MRVSIGCGFSQARFPVEDVKEADALEKGEVFEENQALITELKKILSR